MGLGVMQRGFEAWGERGLYPWVRECRCYSLLSDSSPGCWLIDKTMPEDVQMASGREGIVRATATLTQQALLTPWTQSCLACASSQC